MAKKKVAKKTAERPSFEEALEQLEAIVQSLEEGELGLNEALAEYEKGVKLLRQSYDSLERAERRIELLSGLDAEGNPITQPFDDTATMQSEKRPGASRRSPKRGGTEAGGNGGLSEDVDVDSEEGLF